ncbi:DUF3095 family protein [Roseibium aestuarii]|uniref:DUF3095 family protein n=1 Tax=Roseibium aestuarii TaxID=2600299 RepID=A0ABW4JTJ2_9HYPH|nr:DUF3095 family protein [Roseibium aestuarii]
MADRTEDFYLHLPSFRDFRDIGYLAAYRPVPDDWIVLAADIVQSRRAISEGRQKDVNFVGSAVIASVLNAVDDERIPFVFGGDGAMVLVPGSDLQAGRLALAGLAKLAHEETGLDLRIAAIPVSILRARGRDVRLRKYELQPGNYLAMAVGGGLELADSILKSPTERDAFAIAIADPPPPDLSGLSCRWEPIQSERGRIVSLIIRPTPGPGAERVLSEIRDRLERIIGRDSQAFGSPRRLFRSERLTFRWPPTGLAREIRMVGGRKGRFRAGVSAVFETLVVLVASRLRRKIGPFNPVRYLEEISWQTDHRKLDDSLRLVLDLSPVQVTAMRQFLEAREARGELVFGLHEADEAIMTCFVSDLSQGRHLHFIDGAGGGLSAAATSLSIGLRDQRERRDAARFNTPEPWSVGLAAARSQAGRADAP